MKRTAVKRKDSNMMKLESVSRITNIPIVESSLGLAENIYGKLKSSNSLMCWTLTTAEASLNTLGQHALPAINVFHSPIQRLDKIICKSLDMVEQRVPSVYLPPQLMYWNTKEYMSDHLVKPVLRRADSVKHLGNAVLDSRVTNFAANRLDGALDVADKYIDRYFPDSADVTDDITKPVQTDQESSKAIQTMHHVDRFSRKLQRRLTRRTLAEAKAIKEQIHVIIYVAELIATDPKLAMTKARELWKSLSMDEPENQARPETFEQVLVMLTRESARRMVHLVNFTSNGVAKLPKVAARTLRMAIHQCLAVADTIVKSIHLEGTKDIIEEAKKTATKLQVFIDELQHYTNNLLERFAVFLAGRSEDEKPYIRQSRNSNNHVLTENNSTNNRNNLYN